MNTERTIVLENVASQPVGLKDTQGRTYRLNTGAKMRISQVSLQDILDYPASRIIFNENMVKIKNIDADSLYNMGLNEDEIELYTDGECEQPAIVITEKIEEEDPEEEIITVTKPAAKKTTTTKKTTTKKTTTTKKASSKTTK